MYTRKGLELLKLPKEDVKKWIDSYDTVLFDCDGVLWLFNEIITGSVEVVNTLLKCGKKVFFVTNNSTKTRAEFLEKALNMKFNMTVENIISTAYLSARYLKSLNFEKKVFVIASAGVTKELDAVGIRHIGLGPDVLTTPIMQFIDPEHGFKADPEVGAVVVGFDEHFSFPKMIRACTYLNNPECLFIATNTDERFPMPHIIIPGSGSIVKAVETAAERPPIVMGKPSPLVMDILKVEHNIEPARTLMVGDRCNTDILLGSICGFQTLMVETGIHKREDVKKWAENDNKEDKLLIPDVILPRLGDLLPFLLEK